MKILARVHLYPPDHCAGAEMMLHELLKALVQRGHEVEVHLSRFSATRAPYMLNGVKIVPRGLVDWQTAIPQADVLMTHLDNTSTVISAAIAYDKPLVQVLHNTHAPTRMWASCRNDMLVYNSEWMRIELGDDPNGIVVRPPVRVSDYETDRPWAGYGVTLINLSQAKGGLIFAQLAALLDDTEFIGVEGAYGEQLMPHLQNVEIHAHGADMRKIYAQTRVLLMPSSYESWGRVGIEAMCSGIPVIASATPGLRESLGDAGIFLPPGADVYDWAHQLNDLLGDMDLYERTSQAARARAEELDPTNELAAFCDRVEAL